MPLLNGKPSENTMKKRRNPNSLDTSAQDNQYKHWLTEFPVAFYWTLLAILILIFVYQYDQHGMQAIRLMQNRAHEAELSGEYRNAIDDYKLAFDNSRATSKKKGELALLIGNLYFEKLNDPSQASNWYTISKRYYPKILNSPEKASLLRERITSASVNAESQKLNKNSHKYLAIYDSPDTEDSGNIVAEYSGGSISLNEVKKALKNDDVTSESIMGYVNNELLFYDAVSEGYLDRPEVINILYSSQKEMLVNLYKNDLINSSQTTETFNLESKLNALKNRYQLIMH